MIFKKTLHILNLEFPFLQAVKTEESVKAEEIDGYRGGEDLDSILNFIEDNPKSSTTGSGKNPAPQQTGSGSNSSKSKRSRRTDHKSKRLEMINRELKKM